MSLHSVPVHTVTQLEDDDISSIGFAETRRMENADTISVQSHDPPYQRTLETSEQPGHRESVLKIDPKVKHRGTLLSQPDIDGLNVEGKDKDHIASEVIDTVQKKQEEHELSKQVGSNATNLANLRHRFKVAEAVLKRTGVSNPVGLLAVHVRRLHLYEIDLYSYVKRYNISVYLRLRITNQVKYTAVYRNTSVPVDILIDEVMHFRIEANPENAGDGKNVFHFELIFCDPTNMEMNNVVAIRSVVIHEFIQAQCENRSIEFRDFARQKVMAKLDLETCFAYGLFGYGFSNQFLANPPDPVKYILPTVFFRPTPTDDRKNEKNDVVNCRHVGHPNFVYFTRHAHFYELEREVVGVTSQDGCSCDPQSDMSRYKCLIENDITNNVRDLREKYDSCKSRIERQEFLADLVSHAKSYEEVDQRVYRLKGNFRLRYRSQRDMTTPLRRRASEITLLDNTEDRSNEPAVGRPKLKQKRVTIGEPIATDADKKSGTGKFATFRKRLRKRTPVKYLILFVWKVQLFLAAFLITAGAMLSVFIDKRQVEMQEYAQREDEDDPKFVEHLKAKRKFTYDDRRPSYYI